MYGHVKGSGRDTSDDSERDYIVESVKHKHHSITIIEGTIVKSILGYLNIQPIKISLGISYMHSLIQSFTHPLIHSLTHTKVSFHGL